VSKGHPDKVCDQISDAILDACLAQDPNSRVACETLVNTGLVVISGEITTKAVIDYQQIARKTIKGIGYVNPELAFDYKGCSVLVAMDKQSPDIAQGVDAKAADGKEDDKQGAGDQGMMFGYAVKETKELMPLPISLAHKLMEEIQNLREKGKIKWLRPDAKSQVTVEYDENKKPVRIDTVVVSHQHDEGISYDEIKKTIIDEIIKPVLEPTGLLKGDTKFLINPTGKFVIGGPDGDAGLTGRKIIVDTYGGMGRHGGGAFSGKDPSKVDRSAAYMARYIAKNVVAAGLADRAEVQLSYAIGYPYPVSISVDTFGTETVENQKIVDAVKKVFDCTPAGIEKTLDLRNVKYQPTAAYGHFGRDGFNWEKTDKVEALKAAL